ncbi:Hypothetical predicted protein [Mytilus galloprovincialis]|uniref:SAM domain-containing protein n=1 Tax=Mytilus galloprovincialis TaxID=29158 RepID=A0A8B6DY69_MYTGA|nr:Hypothetical predicted protein [Mytilus galloprovincialis]
METKAPSVKVLKQMSITRQDLEKSSERLADNLSRLQQDNAEQTQVIEERLSEVQKEQITAEQLLQSDWSDLTEDQTNKSNSGTIKKGLRREPTIVRQLRQWTTSDVIRWLEKEGLHKFILTFQRHHVKGEDLAEIRLPFLDNYDHISVSDKELLLSHVYELLRLESEEQDNLEQFTSPLDREKYMAARQISKEARRSPVIFLPSHNSTPSTSPSSTELLPAYPDAAAFTLNVSFFSTDWGISGVEPLITSRYIKRSKPLFHRYKNIYLPNKIVTVDTHLVWPRKGYRRIVLRSHNIILHHYRECKYSENTTDICRTFSKNTDAKMIKIMSALYNRVVAVKRRCGISAG